MSKFEVRFLDKEKLKINTIDVYGETIEEAEETFKMNKNLKLLSIMEVIYETKGYKKEMKYK